MSSIRKIVLLRITRHPAAFENALMQHQQLRVVRADLEKVGTNKVFVLPEDYCLVMAESQRQKLGRHHIVVSDQFLPWVMEVIHRLPHRENVRIKDETIIAYQLHDVPITTRGTFLGFFPSADVRSVATA